MKAKDFYESQEMFSEWRNENYAHSRCMAQVHDYRSNCLFEKWNSYDENHIDYIYIAEIYPHGKGFQIYEMKKRWET